MSRSPTSRSRRDSAGNNLSSFFRERFGSRSPEEYTNLRISNFDRNLQRDEIRSIIESELVKYAPFEVKVMANPEDNERLAYVNFDRSRNPTAAKQIRHHMIDRLQRQLGKGVVIDPAGIVRDQDGKPVDRNKADRNGRRPASPTRGGTMAPKRTNFRLNEDDSQATRTLFVGNLPADIDIREIRHAFERYGKVEDVDIKTPTGTNAAFAFVMFQSVAQAINAKRNEHERSLRPNGPHCKIGYGKSQPTNRLWIGGLGAWATPDMLHKEFDRYGALDRVEYVTGEEYAYIRFADLAAAQDACRAMKGFPLGGSDRRIAVDFAKDVNPPAHSSNGASRKRRASRSPGPRTPPPPQSRTRLSSPELTIDSASVMTANVACTWKGTVSLKKIDYPVHLYRVAGSEKLLQDELRDEDGLAIKLTINQRLALSGQEALEESLLSASRRDITVMIGLSKTETALVPLVNYFNDKEAAGVIASGANSTLYVFPACDFATRLQRAYSPNVTLLRDSSPHLLFVLHRKP